MNLAEICTVDDILLCCMKVGVHLDPSPEGKLAVSGLPDGQAGDVLVELITARRDEILAALIQARA